MTSFPALVSSSTIDAYPAFRMLLSSFLKMRPRPKGRPAMAGALLLSILVAAISTHPKTAYAQGTFSATGSMSTARSYPTATLLKNGQVLVAGGFDGSNPLADAELYDPSTGLFTVTGSMTTARYTQTATLLPNGRVLITGGVSSAGLAVESAELYNPATGTFTATGPMTTTRENHTATLLKNGAVLIAGGNNSPGPLASAELYNPATGIFTATGSMSTSRYVPSATLLQNGQVLIAGGITNPNPTYVASAELYNPATGTFSYTTGSMTTPRGYFTMTLLGDGQVLAMDGYSGSSYLTSAELYDPKAETFSLAGSMISHVNGPETLLGDGLVLVAGGYDGSNYLASAEFYNPKTGIFYTTGTMTTPRDGPAAALLQNGQVLVAGGAADSSGVLASAELYTPPYGTAVGITGSGTVEDNHGPTIDCTATNSTESGTCGATYSGTETVTLTATPAAGYLFGSWTTAGSPTCAPSGNTCSFKIGTGVNVNSITASFLQPQSIKFTTSAPTRAAYLSSFRVAASASSGLTVAFTSSGSCTNVGATYTMSEGTGKCWVIANQAGNASYATAAKIERPVTADPAGQTIAVTTPAPTSADYNTTFTVAAVASSSLTVAFTSSGSCTNSGATYTITRGAGKCSVIASQPGDGNYSAATAVIEKVNANPAP